MARLDLDLADIDLWIVSKLIFLLVGSYDLVTDERDTAEEDDVPDRRAWLQGFRFQVSGLGLRS
jgi:hypothetical protein